MKSSVHHNPPSSCSNPFLPFVDLKGDKTPHLLFPSLSNTPQDQRETNFEGSQQHQHQLKIEKYIIHGGSCGNDVIPSPSRKVVENDDGKLSVCIQENRDGSKDIDDGSVSWMSSEKMNSKCTDTDDHHKPLKITLKTQNQQHSNGCNTNIRVCSDCKTTTTPLWRSGPLGPKSLCNACGIRQRKARRAKEEAASTAADNSTGTCEMPSVKIKVQNKDKKSRPNHAGQYKKQCKPIDQHNSHSQKKHFFKDFALSLSKSSALCRVLPQDDLEAAILLMELSCGLIHS